MGCRQSIHDEELEDPTVESFNYRKKRSTRLKRRKKSTRSSKSDSSVGGVSSTPIGDTEFSEKVTDPKLDGSGTVTKDKNTNERIQMFGKHSINNVLTLSVADPGISTKQSKVQLNHKHGFPKWEHPEKDLTCKCVNITRNSDSVEIGNDVDDNGQTMTTYTSPDSQLCRKCSQAVLHIQNNKRNNNISTNNTSATTDTKSVEISQKNSPSENENNSNQFAAIANLLAMAGLDLSAPASSLLVKNRKNAWIQLAGHKDSFAPAGPNTIWKRRGVRENYETQTYQALSEYIDSRNIIPRFYREVEHNGEFFIEMEDLLHHFTDPSIMDIKMGTRTFLESEVKNPVLRKDLFEKMVKLDPEAPTTEEKEQQAITKLRYMQFREQKSSTASLGFRIEAIRMTGQEPDTNLKKVKTTDEVSYFIQKFTTGHSAVIPVLYRKLVDIQQRFESIPFFNSHEIIGSSLLFMYDTSNQANVWMIDFAKTIPVQDLTLNHRSPWNIGNHEDGYLCGLDNLIKIFKALTESIESKNSPENDRINS